MKKHESHGWPEEEHLPVLKLCTDRREDPAKIQVPNLQNI